MTDKTLKCDPGSAWIFESQCATKHRIKILDEVGDDGVTRIKIGLKASDTAGAFSSKYSEGGLNHSVVFSVRFTPPAADGGASRNIVTAESLGYALADEDGWAWTSVDASAPGTYNTTVESQGGDECCTPKGSVNHTTRVEAVSVQPSDPIGGGTVIPTGPNPILLGGLAMVALVSIGWSILSGSRDGE